MTSEEGMLIFMKENLGNLKVLLHEIRKMGEIKFQ